MWRLLCERASDLRVECGPVRVEGDTASAEWQAWYTYSVTGRRVNNRIAAAFTLEHGLICRHYDTFDLYRWARQALGVKGVLLGWSPPVQRTIRARAALALETFVAAPARHAGDVGREG